MEHDARMPWVAPDVVRSDEPFVAGEREMLQGVLQFGRETLLLKCAGLDAVQLALRAAPPSALSLLGLVRHVTDVERTWLRRRFGRQDVPSLYTRPDSPDAAVDEADERSAERDLARLRAEWADADSAVAGLTLDDLFDSPTWGPMSLRWAYSHLISEYSRHNGHADLLRERIDGATGT